MSNNVQQCPAMSNNVQQYPAMSNNVQQSSAEFYQALYQYSMARIKKAKIKNETLRDYGQLSRFTVVIVNCDRPDTRPISWPKI